MENLININENYEKLNLSDQKINNREFDNCIFRNCNFSNTDFGNCVFIDCEFIDCNLSMLQVTNTAFKTVLFKNSKLLGILFQNCQDFLFNVNFEECILDYASFSNKKMLKTSFESCSMKEVNFFGTNLTGSNLNNCNLENAIFNETNLSNVNFVTANNFKIDPEYNLLKKAKFSNSGIIGLLDKYDIIVE